MIFKNDLLTDNKLLRQRVFWLRLLSIILLIALLLSPIAPSSKESFSLKSYTARIKIDEIIEYNIEKINILDKIVNDRAIKAVVLHVNSPGGTTGGSEAYYRVLRKIGATRPIVVVMGDIATSGGYMVSLAADKIYAMGGTLTGSIGVLMETHEVTELANKLGVNSLVFKTSEYKAAPNMFEKTPEDVKVRINESLQEAYKLFTSFVKERRGKFINDNQIKTATNGAVYIGNEAIKLGLIDAIGTERDAIEWLKTDKKIDLPIYDYELDTERGAAHNFIKKFTDKISDVIFRNNSKLLSIF